MEMNEQKRAALEKQAEGLMRDARKRLYLSDKPQAAFFASLALKMEVVPDWSCDTACTDGTSIRYNPEFVVNTLTPKKAIGVAVHEVMHCSLKHFARFGARDPFIANIAADLAINPLIIEAGFELPDCGLFPGKKPFEDIPEGLSMEEIYDRIKDRIKIIRVGLGDSDDPGGCGQVVQAKGTPDDIKGKEAQWDLNTAQAAQVASGRGKLPGKLQDLIGKTLRPEIPWYNELREFVSEVSKDDYTFCPPNRRMLAQGHYMANLHGEKVGRIAVAVDASGSCWHEGFTIRCNSELHGILESYDCTLNLYYHDTVVQSEENWTRDDCAALKPRGGGGTSHHAVFERMLNGKDELPVCIICITDMDTQFPPDPGIPTLWVAVNSRSNGPFGKTIHVNEAGRRGE